jgi:hypothetical protein
VINYLWENEWLNLHRDTDRQAVSSLPVKSILQTLFKSFVNQKRYCEGP